MRAPEMCGVIKSDGKTKWFPRTDEVRDGMSLVSFETLKGLTRGCLVPIPN